MNVKEVMTGNPITIDINASLDAAADLMARNDIGAIPVEDKGSLRGMITDRDITIRAVARRLDPRTTRVGDTMTAEVYACYEDQDLNEVAKLMEEKQVRRIVVLSRSGDKPAGIVSIGDIIMHGATRTADEVLKEVSIPVHSMPAKKQPEGGRSI